jgi:hypothetical protein
MKESNGHVAQFVSLSASPFRYAIASWSARSARLARRRACWRQC